LTFLLILGAVTPSSVPAKRAATAARRSQYDGGVSQFDPDGNLHQVEYANVAVQNSEPVAAVLFESGIVLAARVRPFIPGALRAGPYFEKVLAIDDHIVCTVAGVGPDASALVAAAREAAQKHRLAWGDPIPPQLLARTMCNQCQAYTQYGGLRPFGAALLLAGYDKDDGFQLISIDPSGNSRTYRPHTTRAPGDGHTAAVAALGKDSAKVRRALLAEFKAEPGAVAQAEFGELSFGQQALDKALREPVQSVDEDASEQLSAASDTEGMYLEVATLALRERVEQRASGLTLRTQFPVVVFGPGPTAQKANDGSGQSPEAE
jgi:20S proteasome alpha/beta subunit